MNKSFLQDPKNTPPSFLPAFAAENLAKLFSDIRDEKLQVSKDTDLEVNLKKSLEEYR